MSERTIHIGPSFIRDMSWETFELKVCQLARCLELDQWLIIQHRTRSGCFVQLGLMEAGVRLETTSNRYLEGDARLSEAQKAALVAMGWHLPNDGPGGSPNFHADYTFPANVTAIVSLALRTLSSVLGVISPAELGFKAGSWDGSPPVASAFIKSFDKWTSLTVERPAGRFEPYTPGEVD